MSAAFRLILQGSQQVPGVVTSASGLGVAIFDSLTNSPELHRQRARPRLGTDTGTGP